MTENGLLRERFMEAALANPYLMARILSSEKATPGTWQYSRTIAYFVGDISQACANEAMGRRMENGDGET